MRRVLIANRGEIACRVIRACHALGLETVAVHSDADVNALHVKMSDASVAIGGAPAIQSYLNVQRILDAAKSAKADAVHPGYGFLSENTDFARAAEAAGIVWIGPTPQSIDDMGDKERAREIAAAAGLPVLPGSARFAQAELSGLNEAATAVGYPLLVKATAGGGGIGMRRVDRMEDLASAVSATQQQAAKAFGDGTVYLEHLVLRARHVEVQVFGYGDGDAVHLFERECSIQRRYQKIIEESPAPELPVALIAQMTSVARDLAAAQRYRGPGTVEFVVDADTLAFFFLEMNTRIQVEHPVTEMITGWDLVQQQIRLAMNSVTKMTQSQIERSGAAVECRLYAENPLKNFMPSPGLLQTFVLPEQSASIRVETGVRQGDAITPYYDPMIAKVITFAADRQGALDRMREALAAVRISGVNNNVAYLQAIVEDPEFRAGRIDTGFTGCRSKELLTAMQLADGL